jgi:hypothetical protein
MPGDLAHESLRRGAQEATLDLAISDPPAQSG